MDLVFVDRQRYRRRQDPAWLAQFEDEETLIVPEGGSSPLAIPGVAELVDEVPFSPDLWVLPCASGGTLAGLIAGKREGEQILAIVVLKGGSFITDEVRRLNPAAADTPGWRIALALAPSPFPPGVDTPEDLARAEARLRETRA